MRKKKKSQSEICMYFEVGMTGGRIGQTTPYIQISCAVSAILRLELFALAAESCGSVWIYTQLSGAASSKEHVAPLCNDCICTIKTIP